MQGRMTSVPLNIVGSTIFGRYPKISVEETFNMIVSDNWLVPSAGYIASTVINSSKATEGRGLYASKKAKRMFSVVGNLVYSINSDLSPQQIGQVRTFSGDVFISENNGSQIAFCDQSQLYIYNYSTGVFSTAILPTGVSPGYVTFQDGYFHIPDRNSFSIYLSALNDGLNYLWGVGNTPVSYAVETKAGYAVAAIRFPGKGNSLLAFGSDVAEFWTDTGAQLEPYQRSSAINIDFGCINAATIAEQEDLIVWLAQNEKSGPVIAYTQGGAIQRLSNDGIDFRLSHLSHPESSFAFFYKQDGHLLYQITFFDPEDNLTLLYDFNTQKFFTLTDELMNYHIARRICLFNNKYYFVSINDGMLYETSSLYTSYNGKEIPRVRTCKNIRLPNSSKFIVQNLIFTMEMGAESQDGLYKEKYQPKFLTTQNGLTLTTQNNKSLLLNKFYSITPQAPRVDLSISKNGGENFGSYGYKTVNPTGKRKNQVRFFNLGMANDFVPQVRFFGMGRFVATDGVVGISQ